MPNLYDEASLILTANAYSASRVFSIKPTNGTGDFTFSRASTKTRVNSSGVISEIANNIPSLNYSSSLSCPTLLLEPTRSNLFWPSDSGRSGSQMISASNDWGIGLINKTTIWNTGSNGVAFNTFGSPTLQTSSVYTISCYVKIIDGQVGTPVFGSGGNSQGYFNLAGGSIFDNALYRKIPLGNNVWKISATSSSGTTNVNNSGFLRWTFNRTGSSGTGSIEISGLQIESGSFETSYIPTPTSVIVTRLGDFLSNTISFSANIGSIFIDIAPSLTGSVAGLNSALVTIGDFQIRGNNASNWQFYYNNASNGFPSTFKASRTKYLITFNSSSVSAFSNGALLQSSTNRTISNAPTSIVVNPNVSNTSLPLNSIITFDRVLSSAEAIALTTL
jgi:hypothetical protein